MPIDQHFGERAWTAPVEAAPGVIRRTLVWGERMLVAEFTVEQGTGVPSHQHSHEQVGYVVSGAMEITIGDEVQRLGPGDGYLIPGNVVHATRALADSVVIDVFSPIREDFV